jgi:hypothetical protein
MKILAFILMVGSLCCGALAVVKTGRLLDRATNVMEGANHGPD